ncbi:MAG TPA: agmatinase [Anaerolineales bacterium]|nr:agmatinase [Anaerolineales bacterium]
MNEPLPTHGLWADLLRPGIPPEDADFTILGIPYDGAVSARSGARLAPARMRFWSQQLTPFSEDRTRLQDVRLCDLGDMQVHDQPADFELIRRRVGTLPNIPIILGGDHSVSIPVLQGQRDRFRSSRLGVLWLDAHPDLCDEFEGSRLSHACVLRRGLEAGIAPEDVCLVGLRSWEAQEVDLIEQGRLRVHTASDVAARGMPAVAADVRQALSPCDAIHISLDIDCLDPAAAPGTGIPDAAGLTAREVLTLLKSLQGLPLQGLDLVEVSPPIDPSEATVFAALKFVMEFVAVCARQKALQVKDEHRR